MGGALSVPLRGATGDSAATLAEALPDAGDGEHTTPRGSRAGVRWARVMCASTSQRYPRWLSFLLPLCVRTLVRFTAADTTVAVFAVSVGLARAADLRSGPARCAR